MDSLTTSQVARRSEINLQTVRYYERQGLLAPTSRTAAGYRIFSSDAVRRIRFIKRSQELGFSLHEIKDLLFLRIDAHTTQADIRKRTQAKIADVEQKIRHLKDIHKILLRLAEDCPGCGPLKDCPISKSGWKGTLMTERPWKQNLLAVPGIGLLFLVSTAYLLPMTAPFLLLAVGMFAFRARRRRGYVPFAIGVLAASFILPGKLSLASNRVLYAGSRPLILASVWSSWPIASRCACVPATEKFHSSGAPKEK